MAASGSQEQFRLGFLTAIEDPERGYVGGLLITNRFGRPLEFQCTAPVKPNRTQQILYGPTLKPFVLGELIGRTLVEKAGVKPHLVLTEQDELLDLRDHVSVPVASLSDEPTAKSAQGAPKRLKLGNQVLTFHSGHDEDQAEIERQAAQIPSSADLKEPFDRVREALTETIKAATASR